MRAKRITTAAPVIAMAAVALLLAACSSTQSTSAPEPAISQSEVLNTTETAPADLQLTCSNAVAGSFGLPPDKVLPVSSSRLPDGTYDVQLSSEGRNFTCRIDENAAILNMSPA